MNTQKLTRSDWLDHAVNSLTDKLNYYLNDRNMSLEQAIEAVKPNTTAGSKAWEIALNKIRDNS